MEQKGDELEGGQLVDGVNGGGWRFVAAWRAELVYSLLKINRAKSPGRVPHLCHVSALCPGKGWCLDTWTHQPCSYQGREKSSKDEVTTQAFGKLGTLFHTCRQRTGPNCTIYLGNLETLTIIGSEFFNPIPPSSPCDPSGSLTKFQFVYPLP